MVPIEIKSCEPLSLSRVSLAPRQTKEANVGKYTEKDAAKDTGASGKQTAAAHHDARTDSGARESKDSEQFEESPGWAKGAKTDSGIPLNPKGKD